MGGSESFPQLIYRGGSFNFQSCKKVNFLHAVHTLENSNAEVSYPTVNIRWC